MVFLRTASTRSGHCPLSMAGSSKNTLLRVAERNRNVNIRLSELNCFDHHDILVANPCGRNWGATDDRRTHWLQNTVRNGCPLEALVVAVSSDEARVEMDTIKVNIYSGSGSLSGHLPAGGYACRWQEAANGRNGRSGLLHASPTRSALPGRPGFASRQTLDDGDGVGGA